MLTGMLRASVPVSRHASSDTAACSTERKAALPLSKTPNAPAVLEEATMQHENLTQLIVDDKQQGDPERVQLHRLTASFPQLNMIVVCSR
jgi:hypothetical protein